MVYLGGIGVGPPWVIFSRMMGQPSRDFTLLTCLLIARILAKSTIHRVAKKVWVDVAIDFEL